MINSTLQLPHFAVVLNPNAGSGLAEQVWPKLQQELRHRQISFEEIREPTGEAALARVQVLPLSTAVMAVGGDGTIGAMLPAMVGTGQSLCIMPFGTGNDFAGMLGLKSGEFTQALDRLLFQPRIVDALEVQIVAGDEAGSTHFLLNGMGMGFDADVSQNMDKVPAGIKGFFRYVWAALTTIKDLQLGQVQVLADGQELYTGPSPLAAVMNGTRYGGGFLISPNSDAKDGLLNVIVGEKMNRSQLLNLMGLVLGGKHLSHKKVRHKKATEVILKWATPIRLHLDGDLHGLATEVKIRILPNSIRLLNG